MIVSKRRYERLESEHAKLAADHAALQERFNSLLSKSETLTNRYIQLRDLLIKYFGNEIFTNRAQNTTTKDGNVITFERWKK